MLRIFLVIFLARYFWAAPVVQVDVGAGIDATVSISGNDLHGQIDLHTGASPYANADLFTVKLGTPCPNGQIYYAVIGPANPLSPALLSLSPFVKGTRNEWTLVSNVYAMPNSTEVIWNYSGGCA